MTLENKEHTKENNWASDKRAFYDALGVANSQAIRFLSSKITPSVRKAVAQYRMDKQDIGEIVNDALVITISNIRDGKFSYMDFSPATYANGVARKLIANRIRTKKPITQEVDDLPLVSDLNPETYLKNKERESIVGQLLQRLGETCQKLIRLKYFSLMKDKEIIEKQLAGFSSINSLKSKRSQCMKKLGVLAVEAGIKEVF